MSNNNIRIAKILYNKSGGTAGKNSITNRITLPTSWVKEIGITSTDREVVMEFTGKEIIIKKK